MAQAFQNNFTSGEVTPLMESRVDLAKYYNGCARLENMLILPFGGVVKRGGTEYIAEARERQRKITASRRGNLTNWLTGPTGLRAPATVAQKMLLGQ